MSGRQRALASLAEAREPWSQLAEATANVFSTWEWADTWWKHFGQGRRLALHTVSQGDRTVAIIPLHLERRAGVGIMRFLGHGVGDQLGPVCGADDLPVALEFLAAAPARASVLLAERLPGSVDWTAGLGGRLLKTDQSPVIDLAAEGSWEDYLGARSSNFRQQVRRRARRLERGLDIRFRLSDRYHLERDLDALIALHAARWGEQSRAFSPVRERFHREFASRALERGWLRLWLAETQEGPVAAWYGLRFAGIESFYQSGRDPAWDRSGVGVGLLEHSIREAFADGMREYRLLRGDEAYKGRYATRDDGLLTVAAARGLPGRWIVAVAGSLATHPAARRAFTRGA